jgi:uncharacterized delta-60 repeat protein
VTTAFGGFGYLAAMLLQPDGNIVAGGGSTPSADTASGITLVRYQPDGRLDATFGTGGIATNTHVEGGSMVALVRQPDGKLVTADVRYGVRPYLPSSSRLVRYFTDGSLDPTFGDAGLVTSPADWSFSAHALTVQPDGKLVLAGFGGPIPPDAPPAPLPPPGSEVLMRFQPDGQLDPTFGTGGTATTHPAGGGIAALVRQPDGRLVAGGSAVATVGGAEVFALARYEADGRLDPTFGTGGLVITHVGREAALNALVLQPDGRLVAGGVAGVATVSGVRVFALARYEADGRLDPTFGIGGLVTTYMGRSDGFGPGLEALVLQPDGRLVAGGYAPGYPVNNFTLVRYEADGQLDPTFGMGGVVSTDVGGSDTIHALVLQPDGRLVAGGVATVGGAQVFALARYFTLDVLEDFVANVYRAALVRPPDDSELAYWVDVLSTTPTPDTVQGMLHVVFESPEFRQRPLNPWQYVEALYQSMLGREPDQAELDWWVQAVLDRFNTLLPAFLASPEFQHLVPGSQDLGAVTLLVGRLYQQVLRRVPSWEEIVWWTDDIMTWCALEDAVTFFFNTLEYLSQPRTLDEHVTVVYGALLAREPEAGEQAWWVAYLAGQLAALEDEVMASPEFEAYVDRLFP